MATRIAHGELGGRGGSAHMQPPPPPSALRSTFGSGHATPFGSLAAVRRSCIIQHPAQASASSPCTRPCSCMHVHVCMQPGTACTGSGRKLHARTVIVVCAVARGAAPSNHHYHRARLIAVAAFDVLLLVHLSTLARSPSRPVLGNRMQCAPGPKPDARLHAACCLLPLHAARRPPYSLSQ